jgi:hypothetical protein
LFFQANNFSLQTKFTASEIKIKKITCLKASKFVTLWQTAKIKRKALQASVVKEEKWSMLL